MDGIGPTAVSVAVSPPPWVAGVVRVAGDLIKPTIGTHFYRCKSPGTSAAASEPTWKTDGTDTTDGSAVWQDMGLMLLTAGEFQINSAGIFIPETSTKIAATGTPVTIGYTTTASTIVQTLVASAGEYRVAHGPHRTGQSPGSHGLHPDPTRPRSGVGVPLGSFFDRH
ncbi:MAG: hypothetical protein H7834_15980 [Magnetococcus sp. YQC-9]